MRGYNDRKISSMNVNIDEIKQKYEKEIIELKESHRIEIEKMKDTHFKEISELMDENKKVNRATSDREKIK